MAGQMTATVIITDGEQRSALAIVRSLGAAGYRIIVASAHPLPLAAASHFCARRIQTPDPVTSPSQFGSMVAAACHSESAAWLIPVTEASLRALLPIRGSLDANLPFPDEGAFAAISDKAQLLATAVRLGIDVPRQVVLVSPEDAREAEAIGFPLVIKPSRSVHLGQRFSIQYASDNDELAQRLSNLPPAAYPVLLQERVTGPGTGIFLLRWGGENRAVFAHRRIREKPPSGGVSVVAESIAADPMLETQSTQLLDAFGWRGVAMVEYKQDVRTSRTVLMEVNGRFWGSLQLAIDAGVDFPDLLLKCAQGRYPISAPHYRIGVRSRWWLGDLDNLLMRLWRSTATLNLPPEHLGRWEALGGFLLERGRNEILRRGDLKPAAWEFINWFLRR